MSKEPGDKCGVTQNEAPVAWMVFTSGPAEYEYLVYADEDAANFQAVSYETEAIPLYRAEAFPSHALRNEHPAGNRTIAGPGERSPDQPREVGRTPTHEPATANREDTERDRAEGSGGRELGQDVDRRGLDAAPFAPSERAMVMSADGLRVLGNVAAPSTPLHKRVPAPQVSTDDGAPVRAPAVAGATLTGETPKADALSYFAGDPGRCWKEARELARQLERELAAERMNFQTYVAYHPDATESPPSAIAPKTGEQRVKKGVAYVCPGTGDECPLMELVKEGSSAMVPIEDALQAVDYIFRAEHGVKRGNDPRAAIMAYAEEFREKGYSWHPEDNPKIRRADGGMQATAQDADREMLGDDADHFDGEIGNK